MKVGDHGQPIQKVETIRATTKRKTSGPWQSGFDGDELLARPGIELVTVDPVTALRAAQQIEPCEHCIPMMPRFRSTGFWPRKRGSGPYDFMLTEPALSPRANIP